MKAGQQSRKNEDKGKGGQRGGGNFANDPEKALEAGEKGGILTYLLERPGGSPDGPEFGFPTKYDRSDQHRFGRR